jgi:hypothetical protein
MQCLWAALSIVFSKFSMKKPGITGNKCKPIADETEHRSDLEWQKKSP